jgi:Trp operon repressor
MEHQYNILKYTEWDELREELLTPEELEAIDLRVKIISDKIGKKKNSKTD